MEKRTTIWPQQYERKDSYKQVAWSQRVSQRALGCPITRLLLRSIFPFALISFIVSGGISDDGQLK